LDQWVNIYSPIIGHLIALLSLIVAFLTLKKATTIQENVDDIIMNKNFKDFYRDKKGELESYIEKFQNKPTVSEQDLKECTVFFSKFQIYNIWEEEERVQIDETISYLDRLLLKYTKLSEQDQRMETINVLLKLKNVYNVIIFKGDN